MKHKRLLILLLFSSHCLSDGVRLGVAIGKSDVDLEPKSYEGDLFSVDDPTSFSLYAGYLFQNGMILDIEHSSLTNILNFGAVDNIRFYSGEVLIGYKFEKGDFYFEPKLGYARWKLKLEEGQLFNPGPELKAVDSGSDPLLVLKAGFSFNSALGLSLSYKYQDFDLVTISTYDLGLDLQF